MRLPEKRGFYQYCPLPISLFLLLTLIIPSHSLASSFTWHEAIEIGLRDNVKIKLAQTKVKEATGGKIEASSIIYPKAKLTVFPLPPVAIINIQQPVYQHETFPARRKANISGDVAFANIQLEILTLVQRARIAFLTILFRQEDLALQIESATLLKAQLNLMPSFFEAGRVSKSDIESLKVRLKLTESRIKEAQDEIQLAKLHLVELLGSEDAFPLLDQEVIGFFDDTPPAITDYQQLVSLAKTHRHDLKLLTHLSKSHQQDIYIAASGYYPSIGIFGDLDLQTTTPSFLKALDTRRDANDEDEEIAESRAIFGGAINWRIYDFGETTGKKRKARARYLKALEAQAAVAKKIPGDVDKALTAFTKNREIYLNLKNSHLAERNREAVTQAFKDDQVTQLQVFSAESDSFKLKRSLLLALYNLEIARVNLYMATGQLVKLVEGDSAEATPATP